MKIAILLLSAAYTNGGTFIDAGETVSVGPEKNEITAERAADIVKGLRATEVEMEVTVDDDAEDDLEGQTVPQLKATAAGEEIDLGSATKKPEILAAIRAERERRAEAHG